MNFSRLNTAKTANLNFQYCFANGKPFTVVVESPNKRKVNLWCGGRLNPLKQKAVTDDSEFLVF